MALAADELAHFLFELKHLGCECVEAVLVEALLQVVGHSLGECLLLHEGVELSQKHPHLLLFLTSIMVTGSMSLRRG